ncbi:type II secretion system F family protein [Candidatus Woesearchaeota archaeon]|nr:type II secretion system F family protein [Candidatus Woesearchaeota archaeon]
MFVKKTLQLAAMFALSTLILLFFFFEIAGISLLYLLLLLPFICIGYFFFFMMSPKNIINKRKRELDQEVLFAGRFLLVKVHSGRPLLNALIEGSQSYGIASKYFKEIVEDINLGTPIEKALDNAVKYSPSEKYRRILFQISTALKVGIDVSIPLSNAIDEITAEQLTEIQRYGKKLNSLALFYMLLAIVLPSIGMAIFVVVGGLLGLPIERNLFLVVTGALVIVQLIFVSVFKASRLSVNL